jgi:hypothetical protein
MTGCGWLPGALSNAPPDQDSQSSAEDHFHQEDGSEQGGELPQTDHVSPQGQPQAEDVRAQKTGPDHCHKTPECPITITRHHGSNSYSPRSEVTKVMSHLT